MASNSIPPPAFSGQSKFASDFQQILTRAVAIAELPMQNMQNEVATLQGQQSSLQGLQTTFASLQSAIQGIGSSAGSMSANSSDPLAVTATATSSALPGTYTIQVTGLGSNTTTISNAGTPVVTDPSSGNISSSSSFTLTVDGNNFNITPTGNSLDALAAAINAAGANVQATIVNVGSNSSPDYRLSVTGHNLAADTIQLNDGTSNLLSTLSTGSPATYQVNGLTTTIDSNSTTVTLAPGLAVNLLQTTSSPATITVGENTTSLSNSLSGFVTAYNAAVDALNAQHGQNAGALAGDSTVLELGQALSAINTYNGGGTGLTSLADIGFSLDPSTGYLSFDPSVLSSASPATIQQFLGTTTSGGFLQFANNTLSSVADPSSGIIQASLSSVQTSINNENNLISQQQDQITTMQNNLQQQLANADATLAVLEQQVTYMGNLFATMYPNVNAAGSSGSSPSVTG